jgi:polysaccharide pyruvyl transferase WcaK-like protein
VVERRTRDAVAVLGHYAQLNLGDESITAATVSAVRRWRPTARIVGISLDPADTRARHGIESFPLRWQVTATPTDPPVRSVESQPSERGRLAGLLRNVPLVVPLVRLLRRLAAAGRELLYEAASLPGSWRALEGIDLVIVAGSNQLLDQFGGAWGFPYTLLRWSVLARLRGARVVLLSVGAGPLSGRLACQFVRWTLRLAEFSSVRDPGSASLVQAIGWQRPLPVMPDLAFSFEPCLPSTVVVRSQADGMTIGVNLMPVHDPRWWPDAEPLSHARYRGAMARFVAHLLERGHRVELFGTQPADEWIAGDLMRDLGAEAGNPRLSMTTTRTLDQLVQLYARCDIITATRFHGIIIALRLARPVLGVCYYRKSREVMRDFGLERFAFDLDSVTGDQLIAGFADLADKRTEVQRAQQSTAAERYGQLERQYRQVFDPAATKKAV